METTIDGSPAAVRGSVPSQSPGTIQRALELLKLLAESDDLVAVRDVAVALALPPSTSHRLLQQFISAGFVVADPASKRYRVGPALYRLAALIHSKADLAKTVQPFLDELTAACDEASLFAVFDRATATVAFAAKADSSQALSYRINLNTPVSAYWGSSSQAILAYLPEPDLERVLASVHPSPVGNRPPVPEARFRAYLAAIRRRGYALTKGQKLPGAVGTAAPVFDAAGVVGSLTVTIPELRFRPRLGTELPPLVMQSAEQISEVLGYRKTGADTTAR
ncbi:MAG TPA: IclR family transcriptional regulator [Streptosporangiaceae bacterium]|nr:IclR family transcriptional regulator [Streptosporangiaceae bacterium]